MKEVLCVGGSNGGGRTGINRIVSIHPSGSSRDLDAPISSLHCLACRITRFLPLFSIVLSLFVDLKNVRSPLFRNSYLSFSLGRSRHYFSPFIKKATLFSRDSFFSCD